MVSGPMANLPNKLMFYLNTLISVKRLERYFEEADLEHINRDSPTAEPASTSSFAAIFDKATLRFPQYEIVDNTLTSFELKCEAISIPKGKMTVVAGDNGSGKTSFLLAFLGELDCIAGRVLRPLQSGTYAYVTQDSWLEQGTIRDNIVFGEAYESDRFDAVLEACALKADLARWTSREHTEIVGRISSVVYSRNSSAYLHRASAASV